MPGVFLPVVGGCWVCVGAVGGTLGGKGALLGCGATSLVGFVGLGRLVLLLCVVGLVWWVV